jgi:hypothetical protein
MIADMGAAARRAREHGRDDERVLEHDFAHTPARSLVTHTRDHRPTVRTLGTDLTQTRADFLDTIESGWWAGVPRVRAANSGFFVGLLGSAQSGVGAAGG